MSKTSESPVWADVDQVEDGEAIKGGAGGRANAGVKAVTDRTLWLKNALAAFQISVVGWLAGKADKVHDHNGVYAPNNHNHDTAYAAASHEHNLSYAPFTHHHDGLYYKEAEVDALLAKRFLSTGEYLTGTALADLNDATTAGCYSYVNSTNNIPIVNNFGFVWVYKLDANNLVQFATPTSGGGNPKGAKMYMRRKHNGTWTQWNLFMTPDSLAPVSLFSHSTYMITNTSVPMTMTLATIKSTFRYIILTFYTSPSSNRYGLRIETSDIVDNTTQHETLLGSYGVSGGWYSRFKFTGSTMIKTYSSTYNPTLLKIVGYK